MTIFVSNEQTVRNMLFLSASRSMNMNHLGLCCIMSASNPIHSVFTGKKLNQYVANSIASHTDTLVYVWYTVQIDDVVSCNIVILIGTTLSLHGLVRSARLGSVIFVVYPIRKSCGRLAESIIYVSELEDVFAARW